MTFDRTKLLDDLEPLIAAVMASGDVFEAADAAMATYREKRDDASRDALFDALQAVDLLAEPIDEILIGLYREAFKNAFEQGLLQASEPAECPIVFHDIWPKLLAEGWDDLPDYRQDDLAKSFATMLRKALLPKDHEAGDTPRQKAEQMLDLIGSGTLPECRGHEIFQNFADGARLFVEMSNWKPAIFGRNGNKVRVPPAKMPDGLVFHATLSVPSGQMLAADSIRIGSLPRKSSELCDQFSLIINYATHRIARTALSARILHLVDVSVGDAGPDLMRSIDQKSLFCSDEADGVEEVARICNDYWGTRIIDRQHLLEMMCAEGQTMTEAEAEIEAWLQENTFANSFEIPPGTWHFYWDDDRETLTEALRAAGIASPDNCRFALLQEEAPIAKEILRDFSAIEM